MSLFFLSLWSLFNLLQFIINSTNPTWNETKYILIHNLNDQLILSIYDYNGHRKNTKIAFAMFELAGLIEDASQDDIISPLLKEGKNRGELRYDIRFYPVIEDEAGKQEVLDSSKFVFFGRVFGSFY